jgi:hypothetical protein
MPAIILANSVDPDLSIFAPSGSVSQRYGSDPSIISKNSKKNLDFFVFYVPSKSKRQKN